MGDKCLAVTQRRGRVREMNICDSVICGPSVWPKCKQIQVCGARESSTELVQDKIMSAESNNHGTSSAEASTETWTSILSQQAPICLCGLRGQQDKAFEAFFLRNR